MKRLKLAAVLAAAVLGAAGASDPGERLKDPVQEARAEHLFTQLRCLVCQNESIDESQADLARDLRQIVRQQVEAGRSDAEIKAFLVARYGEFILLKPKFTVGNALLWLGPVLIVLSGGAFFAVRSRRNVKLEPALTAEEEARLSALEAEAGDRGVAVAVGTQGRGHDAKVT